MLLYTNKLMLKGWIAVEKRIHIFTGHFGSGKTEIAVNYAIDLAKKGNKTVIVDLDIVNTYFRSLDAKTFLEKEGVEVIAPLFANSNLEMQMMPPEVLSVFEKKDAQIVFDVGGDEDGAFALGAYKRFFEREGYEMYFVVNTSRPLTQNKDDILVYMDEIERASRLNITKLINNANIQELTDEKTLYKGDKVVKEVSDLVKIEYKYITGVKEVLDKIDINKCSAKEKMHIKRFLKLDF